MRQEDCSTLWDPQQKIIISVTIIFFKLQPARHKYAAIQSAQCLVVCVCVCVCVCDRLDKCTMIAMDIDIRDKNHSQGLDDALHQLRNSSCSIAFHHGIENVDNTFVRRALTRSSAIAEGPRDAPCRLKSCQLPRNSAATTCTTSREPSISCR